MAERAEELLGEARQRKTLVSVDVGAEPSRQIPDKILQVARKVDILFVTQDEASALTGKQDAFEALEALEACATGEVVMKLGERGSLMWANGAPVEVPPFAVTPADTTGAGDAFAAAFVRARLFGWPQVEAALLANAAGAAAASVVGAGECMPAPAQIGRVLGARLDSRWEPVRIRALARLKEELPPEDFEQETRGGGTHADA